MVLTLTPLRVEYSVRPVMRRALLAAVVALVVLAAPVRASGGDSTPTKPPPRVPAAAWFLVGGDGTVLAEHQARQRRAPASITKLMTALVALERSSPSETVVVDPRAVGVGESTVYLRAGERLTVAELLRAMLIRSANDAAQALALHVGAGSVERFVELMNAEARELGLADTTFRNPHGLDQPGHVSSARDATLLLRHALGVALIRDALGRTAVSLSGGRSFPTTDDLLTTWPPLLGGKTGHTQAAGWSEAGAARARGVTVYGTVLGSGSRGERNDALRTLLEHGLGSYVSVPVVDRGRAYAEAGTQYGGPAVEVVAPRSVVRPLLRGTPLVERVVVPSVIALPVRAGQPLGRVEVWRGDELVAFSNLVAAETVPEPGLVGKARWYATRTIENLWGLVA
jgi:D-alanyl-D-alanine carboxypeptidase (penicillin-binding protein 5/6)